MTALKSFLWDAIEGISLAVRSLIAGILLAILTAAVAAMWGASIIANYVHTQQLAAGSEWATLLSVVSGSAEIQAAGMLLAGAAAMRKRLWGSVGACVVLWIACFSWSVYCGAGWFTGLLEHTAAINASKQEVALSHKQQLGLEIEKLGTLQATSVRTRSQRVSLEQETARQRQLVDDARAKVLENPIVEAEPIAMLYAKSMGLTDAEAEDARTSVRLWRTIGFFAVFLLGANFGLLALSALFRAPAPSLTPVSPALVEDVEYAEVVDSTPPQLQVVGGTEARRTEPPTVNIKHMVNEFVNEFRASPHQAQVETSLLRNEFRSWCSKRGVSVDIQIWHFGQLLSQLGVKRTTSKNRAGSYFYKMKAA